MRLRPLCLAGFALALCPSPGLAAGRPGLGRLSDAYDGSIASSGAAFQADGSRFATFSDAAGQLVALDAQTNRRRPVGLEGCGPGQPPVAGASVIGPGGPDVFYPVGLDRGELITFCYGSATERFRLIDLATRADRLVSFDPPPNDGPFNDLTTPLAVGSAWVEMVGGQPPNFDHGLFNLGTGAILAPSPAIGAANQYEDLDSPQLTHRLCGPVTTTDVEQPPAGRMNQIDVNVVGFERPYAVLEVDTDIVGGSSGSATSDAELYTWRCGAAKPVALGRVDPGREQFGAGIVTWVDGHLRVNAEDLATGRHWTWPTAASAAGKVGYAEALHTAGRIYAVRQVTAATAGGPQVIYTASLAGLRRRAERPTT